MAVYAQLHAHSNPSIAEGASHVQELAFRAGLHRTYVGSAERGERNVSLINIERLARALDVDICDLFDRP